MINNFYKIKNNTLIGIDEKRFKKYLLDNKFKAPDIPAGITKIKSNIFNEIDRMDEIYLPMSIGKINLECFEKFKNIIINYANYYDILIVDRTPYKKHIKCLKIAKIHNLKYFDEYLLENNGKNPTIPKGVVFIGEYVFKNNLKLKEVILPKSAIAIYKQAFMNCSNLQKIKLSPLCVDFGEEAFKNCNSLKQINISKSMFSIRENVFKHCNKLKIKIFDEYLVDYEEFHLKDELANNKNLECKNRFAVDKVLETNSFYFVLKDSNVHKLEKSKIDIKNTSNSMILYETKMERVNVFNLLQFMTKSKELPYSFIINNTNKDYVDKFYLNYISFKKNIIKKIVKKFKRPLNNIEYENLYKIAIISGFFENINSIKNKSTNFIINYLFSIDKNNGLHLDLEMFVSLFKSIRTKNVSFNKEFSETFLYNLKNLKLMIEEVISSKNYELIKIILSKCGESSIYYMHNKITKKSLGLLHDEYINYSQNNKLSSERKNFIEWTLKKNNFNNYVTKKDILNNKIYLFYKYYESIEAINRLVEVFNISKNLIQYSFYNIDELKNNYDLKKINVSSIYSEPKYREFKLFYNDNELKEFDSKKLVFQYDKRFSSKIMNKSNYLNALINCEFGTCANIGSSGSEYIYESYLDYLCQPFFIFDNSIMNNNIIGLFRININQKNGIGVINSLEVSKLVKYNYTDNEKNNIIEAFDGIIKKFVGLYNKFNSKKIKSIYLGCITHCGIDSYLEKKYKSVNINIEIKDRITIKNTKNSYLLVWKG